MSQRWLGVYFAKAFESLETPKLLIRWIDEQMGYGVFALETIPKGTFLGCYGGELRSVHLWSPGTTDYWFLYAVGETPWRRLVVDASKSGCHTRFFNHSDRPNTLSSSAWRGNLLEIFFYAQKEIPVGTELTYDYGIDYWSQGRRKRPLDV